MGSEDAIETVRLTKTFRAGLLGRRGQAALAGVDLTVRRGEAFGLIGPNGAGKTTFIKSILGVVRPSGGEVRVLGGDPQDPAVRARIGYLPERLHLPGASTPRAFLRSVGRLKRLALSAAEVDRMLGRVGLGEAAGRRIGGFSKGMRQRLGLASALLGQPALLVLDEPTDGVDPLGRREIRELLGEELARGATLFLNSHLLSETERVCGRIGILSAGKLVREGPLESLKGARTSWRARFEPGVAPEILEAEGFARTAQVDVFVKEAEDAASLNGAIDRARAKGALLVELTPERSDLEAVLAEAVGGAR